VHGLYAGRKHDRFVDLHPIVKYSTLTVLSFNINRLVIDDVIYIFQGMHDLQNVKDSL